MSTVISTLFVKIKVSVFETTNRAAIKPVGIYNGTYCFFNQNENEFIMMRRKKGENYNEEICI